MPIPVPVIITTLVQIADIILKRTAKHPEEAPQFSGATRYILEACSRAAEETPEETDARLALHDNLIAQYAQAPPPGVTFIPGTTVGT